MLFFHLFKCVMIFGTQTLSGNLFGLGSKKNVSRINFLADAVHPFQSTLGHAGPALSDAGCQCPLFLGHGAYGNSLWWPGLQHEEAVHVLYVQRVFSNSHDLVLIRTICNYDNL